MGAIGSMGLSPMGPSTSSASLQPSGAPPAPLSLLGLCFGLNPEQEEAVCAAFAAAGHEILPVATGGGEVAGGSEGGALSPVVSGARTGALSAEVEAEAEAEAEAGAGAGAVAVAAEAVQPAAVAAKAEATEAARSAAEAEAKAAEEAPPFQSNFEAACHVARVAAEAQAAAAELEAPRSLGLPRD